MCIRDRTESDEDSFEGEEEIESNLIHGEEVYLINDNTQVLKAKIDGEAMVSRQNIRIRFLLFLLFDVNFCFVLFL